jgi:hypothetical protein
LLAWRPHAARPEGSQDARDGLPAKRPHPRSGGLRLQRSR